MAGLPVFGRLRTGSAQGDISDLHYADSSQHRCYSYLAGYFSEASSRHGYAIDAFCAGVYPGDDFAGVLNSISARIDSRPAMAPVSAPSQCAWRITRPPIKGFTISCV